MARKHPKRGLQFINHYLQSAHLAIFSDASFESNEDYSSKIWFIIYLVDINKDANFLHYSSEQSRLVAKSSLAVEMFAIVHAFD